MNTANEYDKDSREKACVSNTPLHNHRWITLGMFLALFGSLMRANPPLSPHPNSQKAKEMMGTDSTEQQHIALQPEEQEE